MLIPSAKAVKDVIEATIGREVTITPVDKMDAHDAAGGLVATYCDDSAKLRAVICFSPEAAAYIGCSFALLPAGPAKEMASERSLRNDVVDNVSEICNVFSAVFEHPSNPDVRLARTYWPTAEIPDTLATHVFTHFNRADFVVEVNGYGSGRLCLVGIDA